jgi:hypothetical protein
MSISKLKAKKVEKKNEGMTVIDGVMTIFTWEKEQGSRVANVSVEGRTFVTKGAIFVPNKNELKSFNSINRQIAELKAKQKELLVKMKKVFPEQV